MAERRMFAKSIIDSDAFLDLPQSTQLLYFHLAMRADDDGFVNNPKRVARTVGCGDDDARLLLAKQFIISFASGVIVIRHWRMHNYIQKDRYHETVCKDEKASIQLTENGTYLPLDTACIQNVSKMDTEVRLGKDSISKSNIYSSVDIPPVAEVAPTPTPTPKTKRFIKPTLEDVAEYCQERKNSVNAEKFIAYYEANGWKVGKNAMKDWKAAVRSWEYNDNENAIKSKKTQRGEGTSFLRLLKEGYGND